MKVFMHDGSTSGPDPGPGSAHVLMSVLEDRNEKRPHCRRCIRSVVEHIMNIEHYKQRLLDLEKTLSARIGGPEADQGRGEFTDSAHDVGDASVADEVA